MIKYFNALKQRFLQHQVIEEVNKGGAKRGMMMMRLTIVALFY